MALISYVFFAAGLALFGFGIWMVNTAARSARWPSVEGRVEQTLIRPDGGQRRYHNCVEYSYTVDGETHRSRLFALGDGERIDDWHPSREAAQAAMPYRPGETVEVFYNPENPASAVLDPGIGWSAYVPIGLGLLVAACGLLIG